MDISTQFKRTALATAVCAALMAPQASIEAAEPPIPSLVAFDAVEQQVNTSTLPTYRPVVAADADGDFVVVWGNHPFTASCIITARKYNADGSPATAEIPVSSYTTSCYTQPDVAMDADGDFVVAWTDFSGSSFDVLAQRYDSAGTAQGSPIQVAASTSTESEARVAMDADGDFAVAWKAPDPVIFSNNLYLQRYASSGALQGVKQSINTMTIVSVSEPDIAMDADGDLVAVWDDGWGAVKGRIFPATATAGTEFSITAVTSNVVQPRVAADADGDFVVSWKDSLSSQLLVRGFDKSGAESIPQTYVATLDVASRGDVAMDADGDFAVTWGYWNTFVTPNVIDSFIRRFDRTDTLIASSQFNGSVDGGESSSSIAMDADGDMVVVWEPDYDGTDGGNDNSYFRRYQGPEDVDLALSTSASPDPVSDGGSLTYTASVTNNHTIVAGTTASQDLYFSEVGAATAVTLTDTLPAGTTYVSASGTGWNCSESSGTVSCSMAGSLLPSSNSSVDILVTTPLAITTLSNSASVAANQLDSNMNNNSDTLTTDNVITGGGGGGGGGATDPWWLALLSLPLLLRRRR